MTDALHTRILQDLEELERVVDRCADIWAQYEDSGDDRYVDGAAFNLQSFYTGAERIIELIINEVDQNTPSGPNWHQALLQLATEEIPDLRSAIISEATRDELDRYRGFRHVARNIYAFELDREQIAPLIQHLWPTFERVKAELSRFAEALAEADEDKDSND